KRGGERAAESALLGAWLLRRAGLGGEEADVTLAPGGARDSARLHEGRVSGTVHRVPWARDAARIVLLIDGHVAVVERAAVTIMTRTSLAGDASDTVVCDGAAARSAPLADPEVVLLRGALTRVALMAGALERASEIAIEHAGQRQQFGRPIASFQAVQQHLVTIAQQAALAAVAADTVALVPGAFEIAAAKLLANRAALSAGRAAHQVLGARGTTREHPLGQLTRRLWVWRSEYGDEHHWSTRLGAAVAEAGADSVYPAITGGSTVVNL
ncbi:MAG TPA: acyl-CoA dehydrogenase family protein, partial [Solirubrobacteraceae bacterium]|nr:acyl-CoA dehydrogenase family protein [Solirubrobacteraceae bacterium]